MEVIENTHTRLTLRLSPWKAWFKVPIFGLVILGIIGICASFTLDSYRYYVLAFSGIITVVGLLVSSEIYRDLLWSFDKKSNAATQYERRPGFLAFVNVPCLFSKLPAFRKEIVLEDIADVRVDERKLGSQYYYRVVLVLTTGESEPMTLSLASGPGHPQTDRQTADCVKSFLHIVRPQYTSGLEHYV